MVGRARIHFDDLHVRAPRSPRPAAGTPSPTTSGGCCCAGTSPPPRVPGLLPPAGRPDRQHRPRRSGALPPLTISVDGRRRARSGRRPSRRARRWGDPPGPADLWPVIDRSTDSVLLTAPHSAGRRSAPSGSSPATGTSPASGSTTSSGSSARRPSDRSVPRTSLMMIHYAIQGFNDLFERPVALYDPPRSFIDVTFEDDQGKFSGRPGRPEDSVAGRLCLRAAGPGRLPDPDPVGAERRRADAAQARPDRREIRAAGRADPVRADLRRATPDSAPTARRTTVRGQHGWELELGAGHDRQPVHRAGRTSGTTRPTTRTSASTWPRPARWTAYQALRRRAGCVIWCSTGRRSRRSIRTTPASRSACSARAIPPATRATTCGPIPDRAHPAADRGPVPRRADGGHDRDVAAGARPGAAPPVYEGGRVAGRRANERSTSTATTWIMPAATAGSTAATRAARRSSTPAPTWPRCAGSGTTLGWRRSRCPTPTSRPSSTCNRHPSRCPARSARASTPGRRKVRHLGQRNPLRHLVRVLEADQFALAGPLVSAS